MKNKSQRNTKADARRGFSLGEAGLSTPRGEIPWRELIALRLYWRAPQKRVVRDKLEAHVRHLSAVRADIDFIEPESRTFVPVTVINGPEWLSIEIEAGDIVEPLGGCWRVMGIEVAPTLLAASGEGSFLMPLFSGLTTPVAHTRRLCSLDRIYSQQSEWEKFGLFNAFGLSTRDGSILGIVHGGEFRAWVQTEADPAAGSRQFAVIGIREEPSDMLEQETKSVLFKHLPDAKDYTGMALAYRDYLLGVRGLLPLAERARRNPALEKMLSSMRFNIFLGMKNWPFKPDGSSPYFNSTTFEEAGAILEEARAAGLSNCWVTLVGWIKDGHDGAYPSHFPVNERAGGEGRLRELLAKIRSWGWPVTPHDNIHSLYTASPDFDGSLAAVTRGGEMEAMGLWSGGLCNIACPQIWIHRHGGEFDRIKELGFDGVYYIDALATGLFRCHDPRHPADEKAFALGQARVLGYVRDKFGASATEAPAAYILKYIDYGAAGGSWNRAKFPDLVEGDTKAFIEEGGRYVPFYLAATHGIIATQCDWMQACRGPAGFLPLFVDGVVPAVEACMRMGSIGDFYRNSISTALEPYRICFEIAPDLVRGLVVEFEEFAPECVRYKYDNGLEVFVNATDKPHARLRPMSLRILRNGKTVYATGAKGQGSGK